MKHNLEYSGFTFRPLPQEFEPRLRLRLSRSAKGQLNMNM